VQRHEIRPSIPFILVCVVLGLVSFGIVPLLLILARRGLPNVVDDDGLTLGDGTRIPWTACTHVAKVPGTTQLVFGGTTVSFPTFSIRRGKQILGEIRQRLGLPPQ
jgi:hypothetical protein